MDKLQWFKFSPSDWMMGKIQRCPDITQARFMRLCCLYWNKECELNIEDAEIEIDEEHLDILFKKKIIGKDDNFIHINFLDEQFKEREDNLIEKSKSGSIGNLKRWHPSLYVKFKNKELSLNEAITQSKLSHTDSEPIAEQSQNIAEKRREEERREEKNINNTPSVETEDEKDLTSSKNQKPSVGEKKKESSAKESFNWDLLLEKINKETGRKFQKIRDDLKPKYIKLLKDFSKKDISLAIENASKAPNHQDNGCRYLTPDFFTRKDKIEMYSAPVSKNDSEKIVATPMRK